MLLVRVIRTSGTRVRFGDKEITAIRGYILCTISNKWLVGMTTASAQSYLSHMLSLVACSLLLVTDF